MHKAPSSISDQLCGVDRGASMRHPSIAFKRGTRWQKVLGFLGLACIGCGIAFTWPRAPKATDNETPAQIAMASGDKGSYGADLVPQRQAPTQLVLPTLRDSGWQLQPYATLAPVDSLALSPDGRLLALVDEMGNLTINNLTTSQPLSIPKKAAESVTHVRWQSGSQLLAIATHAGVVMTLNTTTLSLREHTKHAGSVLGLGWCGTTPVSSSSDGFLIFHALDPLRIELGEPAISLSVSPFGARVFGSEGAFLCTDAQGAVWRRSRMERSVMASHTLAAGREMVGLGSGRWLEVDIHTSEVIGTCNLNTPDMSYARTGIALRGNSLVQRQSDGGHRILLTEAALAGAISVSSDINSQRVAILFGDGRVEMLEWIGFERLVALARTDTKS